jgi:sigma-B regulation protein RsbU (phosphoserine phosphatase)
MPTPAILIVDDTPTNVDLLECILSAEGFRTLTASDGPSARAISRAAQPDLILLDVMMPEESGFETCARLRADPETADIPVIFLSAMDAPKDRVQGLNSGAVDYICKPIYREEVLARVRVHLRIRETNRLLLQQVEDSFQRLTDVQRSMLVRPADCPEASFAVFYRPLEGASGDFYDVVSVDPEVSGYFVADISGHGVGAGFFTPALKALLRQQAGPLFSIEDTMRDIDAVMHHVLSDEQYLTACYARLNRRTHRLSIVNAGHPPAVLLHRAGKAESVEAESDPLGVFPIAVLQRRDLTVRLGDRLFLYTDGIIESSPGAPRRAGIERLMAAAEDHQALPLEQAVSRMVSDLCPAGICPQDDLLLLGVEVSW